MASVRKTFIHIQRRHSNTSSLRGLVVAPTRKSPISIIDQSQDNAAQEIKDDQFVWLANDAVS